MPLLSCLLAGAVIFVDASATGANDGSSWANALTDLQSALTIHSQPGDEIWVAAGTYRAPPTGYPLVSFRVVDRRLYGGFAGTESSLDQRAGLFDQTILTGDLLGDDGPGFTNRGDNSPHVAIGFSYPSIAVIDGFTIRGGHADLSSPWDNVGGGLVVGENCEVRNVAFVDNFARQWGGAVYVDTVFRAALIRCTFVGNECRAQGGAVYNSTLVEEVTVDRCLFVGNGAREGGAFWGGGVLRGCVFSGNRARGGRGGGAISGFWGIDVRNCTFFANDATGSQEGGGAILLTQAFFYYPFANDIFWKNVDDQGEGLVSQIRLDALTPFISLESSCIPEFHPTVQGSGNLRTDPLFLDPLGPDGVAGTPDDDLRLRPESSCIDRADDALASNLASRDVSGALRRIDALACGDGGVLDIGAHESPLVQGTTNYCAAVPSSLGSPAILAGPCEWTIAAGPLTIVAGPVPRGVGYVHFGTGLADAPFGDGRLCVGPSLRRTAVVATTGAALAATVDPSDPALAPLLLPGTTFGFQAVYRDPAAGGAGFNLSDAIRVTFR